MGPQTTAPLAVAFVRPTKSTVFWRTNALWQLVRFVIVNLRISRMILRSHDTQLTVRK